MCACLPAGMIKEANESKKTFRWRPPCQPWHCVRDSRSKLMIPRTRRIKNRTKGMSYGGLAARQQSEAHCIGVLTVSSLASSLSFRRSTVRFGMFLGSQDAEICLRLLEATPHKVVEWAESEASASPASSKGSVALIRPLKGVQGTACPGDVARREERWALCV